MNDESLNEIKTYFEPLESNDNNFSQQSYKRNLEKKQATDNKLIPNNEITDEIDIYNQNTKNIPTIEKLSEIANNKYVWAEIVSIEKNNSKAKVVLEAEEMICQIQGKLVKYLKIGQKIKAKITSFKDNEIKTISVNI
ncbi:MAG TPA: hypothetical protein PLP65_04680 [Bacteroidales bacterium]|nr:hypothetical protein [Bacteroidales bacterium]